MGAEGHDPHTLFVQVSIDLHERQATPGEVAHTRHKPTILLARLPWQRLELGLGVVHGLELVVLHAGATPSRTSAARRGVRVRVFLPEGESLLTRQGGIAHSPQPVTQSFAGSAWPLGARLLHKHTISNVRLNKLLKVMPCGAR